jgi:type II pantothenate kinase
MLVRDIYGGDYTETGLSGSTVASSFGKLVMKENPREGLMDQDLALALLIMITNNLGQVAHLNARLHNCSKIYFVGSFLRRNPISCRRLAFAIDFWSRGTYASIFLSSFIHICDLWVELLIRVCIAYLIIALCWT